ncbi:MAG: ATP-binding protein [Melioribacteraceae bacterium]
MICYLYPKPIFLLFSHDVPVLLYYAQIPATIIALLLSFYIFWNNKKSLLGRLLFLIAVLFSIWTITTLIVWAGNDGGLMVFIWPFYNLILGFIAVFCVYFIYVFLTKKDVGSGLKLIFLALLAPILILATTNLNIGGFNITNCDAFDFEWLPLKIYSSIVGVISMIWILFLLIHRHRSDKTDFRKQITLLGAGIELFLFSFLGMEFVATYFTRIGILPDSGLELYGMFGMTIFMVYIIIVIVRFHTFNIKLVAAQALIWGLIALIGSQFFFIKTQINFILNGVGFIFTIILGYFLVRAVKKVDEQREALDLANRQQTNLLHFISHQVKGFFTKSRNAFSGLLEGDYGTLPETARHVIQEGFDSDNRGVQTVQEILNAANIKTGNVTYLMVETNLVNLIKDVILLLKPAADKKQVAINFNPAVQSFILKADTVQLQQAIKNLIDNSIKYTPSGKIDISLEVSADKKQAVIKVADTGVGIHDEDMPKLFSEGGRGKDSLKVNVDSTGYGLYIVKNIIKIHGGTVTAYSEGEGHGSVFTVVLPVKN